jgi:hypothetical protein
MHMTVESVFKDADQLCHETLQAQDVPANVRSLAVYAVCGSALYGATMGMYHSLLQAMVSAIKVPLLFLATLAICLPTLHFIGLLFGSTMKFGQSLIILLAGIALTSILLGAFAPISLLFLVSGSEYPFLLLMHVTIFAFCGGAGLYAIQKNFVTIRSQATDGPTASISDQMLKVWMFLYMFVGTQTAFVLSPFIEREPAFRLFNHPKGNFYSYVWSILLELLRQT